MSANLYIHVANEKTILHVREYLKEKYWSADWRGVPLIYDEEVVAKTPSVWIGEVFWPNKMNLAVDATLYVPATIARVNEIIGDSLPVIDNSLIKQICEAFTLANNTCYLLAEVEDVISFLVAHKGEYAFTISW